MYILIQAYWIVYIHRIYPRGVDETKDAVERGSTHVLPNSISNVGRLGRQVKEFSIAERSAAESGIRNG